MRRFKLALVIIFIAGMVCAEVSDDGSISGKITNPKECKGVQALMRRGRGVKFPSRPKVIDGKYDSKTGEFRFENLPTGQYDLRLQLKDALLDGVDMRIGPMLPGEKPFKPEDAQAIKEVIANLPAKFVDICRPIFVKGNGPRARALVEKIRYTRFHSGKKGELIWRVEVWSFEKQTGVWVKTGNRPVICRLRVPNEMKAKEFHDMTWFFSAELGGFEIGDERAIEGISVTVPKPELRRGKTPGSVEKQIEEHKKKQSEEENDQAEDKPKSNAVLPLEEFAVAAMRDI